MYHGLRLHASQLTRRRTPASVATQASLRAQIPRKGTGEKLGSLGGEHHLPTKTPMGQRLETSPSVRNEEVGALGRNHKKTQTVGTPNTKEDLATKEQRSWGVVKLQK